MKRCPICNNNYAGPEGRCPVCGATPQEIGGVMAFAPALANENDGMDPQAHDRLDRTQDSSFWFRTRNRLIIDLMNRYFGNARDVFEIGCGTGYVLKGLQNANPALHLSGSEIYANGLVHARRRLGANVELYQMDARAIPFTEEFDVIGAFDVLEHIEEDDAVLDGMVRALRPGGGVLLSVPQHPILWSRFDELACHKRRYRRGELAAKCRAAGMEVLRATSFVSSLLPVMFAQRLVQGRRRDYDTEAELTLSVWLDRSFEILLDLERRAIAAGFSFPAGGSQFVVARKPRVGGDTA